MYALFLCLILPFAGAFFSIDEDPGLLQRAYLKSLLEDLEGETAKRWAESPRINNDIYLEEELKESPDEYDEEVPFDLDLTGLKHQSIRDSEYLRHSSLGFKSSGGNDEGFQFEDYSKPRSDTNLPAYCNPPNPCPLGYTEKDGCIEQFENSAAFSRAYQAAQDCMCDNEHMFDCSTRGSENQPISFQKPVNSALRRIMAEIKQIPNEHKTLAAKKFFEKRVENPYLVGEKLPIAAKKGFGSF
ncbi:neuroendocrine protein 7B2-like [Artemia franciscana]|uniref:neuroendocrine protein 7B2-like n=1 Tax=Artemia franciscana TaxID=6661 RepID=UPI0032DB9210